MERSRKRVLVTKKEMKIVDNIFINQFENYQEVKENLINLIKSSPGQPHFDVTKTDWDGGYNHNRNSRYWILLFPFIEQSLSNIKSYLYREYSSDVIIHFGYVWYQIYEYGSFHSYHTHPGCSFSNVFFVNLPDKNLSTDFVGVDNLDLQEGDLVTFPSYILHRSPKNLSKDNKIVVAFNISFDCNKRFDF